MGTFGALLCRLTVKKKKMAEILLCSSNCFVLLYLKTTLSQTVGALHAAVEAEYIFALIRWLIIKAFH